MNDKISNIEIGKYHPFDSRPLGQPKYIGGEQRANISEWGKKMMVSKSDFGTFFTKIPLVQFCDKGVIKVDFSKMAPL